MRPARLEISLNAISHNLGVVRSLVGDGVRVIAVVKAEAYGHGALRAAHACRRAGADMLAVALVEEGIALRQQGILTPILVMGAFLPSQAQEFVAWRLTPAVMSLEQATALSAAAHRLRVELSAHLKVDTGMSRGGLRHDSLRELLPQLAALPALRYEGIMSHLADPANSAEFTDRQRKLFADAVAQVTAVLGPVPYQHLAASAAICCRPDCHFTAVRPGNMLYGALEDVPTKGRPPLRPAMALKACIALLKPALAGEVVSYGCTYRVPRDTTLAVVPVGYADGYPRALSSQAEALVGGQRCPLVGRVCMDSVMVDVGGVPTCRVGDEVVLLGRQGEETITVEELARRAGTITQEIMARMGSRLPRVYMDDEQGTTDA